MNNPFRPYIDHLLARGEYAQAAALARIDNWQPYSLFDMLEEMNQTMLEMAQAVGEALLPIMQQTSKVFEDFQVAAAGVDLSRL